MSDVPPILKAAAASQHRIEPDTDFAICQLASVLRNDAASEDQIVAALRHWSCVVVEARGSTGNRSLDNGGYIDQIRDIVELSNSAKAAVGERAPS